MSNLATQEKVANTPKKSGRRKRASLDVIKTKLDAPTREGFRRRWVNDNGNRVADLYQRDYEHVKDPKIHTDGEGTTVQRRVGTKKDGSPLFAYLMEIKEEYYQEDQKEKQRPLDEFDSQLMRAKTGADAGDGLVVDTVKIETTK